jgi:hypothetical protein
MRRNPFALVRASDFSDEQINSLWVELGQSAIDQIIEPRERLSKFILGGKGAGKTHLLRYHSYPVARLRCSEMPGLSLVKKHGYIAVFLRATGIDAARFEASSASPKTWQHLFGIYLELRLAELVIDSLCDIECSSKDARFDFPAFLRELTRTIDSAELSAVDSMIALQEWIVKERRGIDSAVNNAAFTGRLDVRASFAIGGLCLPLGRALGKWHPTLINVPLLYMVDEIENFSASQQQVVNTLIRYGEGLATFRVSGRLYSMETHATLGNGEENREGAEFKVTNLDEIMRGLDGYPAFAQKFIAKRLESVSDPVAKFNQPSSGNPSVCFEEVDKSDFYQHAVSKFTGGREPLSTHGILSAMGADTQLHQHADEILTCLSNELPAVIAKLNVLIFCKKYDKRKNSMDLAVQIRSQSERFVSNPSISKTSYSTAYGHWANDLFAQICHESSKLLGVPYAGLPTFIKMSCGNPRNLLIILSRAYAVATFKGIDFTAGKQLPVNLQTEAVSEAAQFMYESDTNFGSRSEKARQATSRLGDLLRTARYSLNIPEVSPLAVSFSNSDLTDGARETLLSALNYSFVFEVSGRPDRNSKRLNRKIQLNPLLAPRWELPISRRGDISLSTELVNAIFDAAHADRFEHLLRALAFKWNNPFSKIERNREQVELFT